MKKKRLASLFRKFVMRTKDNNATLALAVVGVGEVLGAEWARGCRLVSVNEEVLRVRGT